MHVLVCLPTTTCRRKQMKVLPCCLRAPCSTLLLKPPLPPAGERLFHAWAADQGIVHDVNWLATNVPLMQQDMAAGTWEANDDLLVEVISHLNSPSTFFHGHHTLIHLSRDQLRESDCFTEDTGMYDKPSPPKGKIK